MKNLLLLFIYAFSFGLNGQSFIFCPRIETEEKSGFEKVKVSIVFLDSRSYNKKPKDKCSKLDIIDEFTQCIRRTYPEMQLTVLQESDFYKEPSKENMTIKVKLKKYDATFSAGIYNSTTQYEVQIYAFAEKDSLIEQTVEGKGKAFNTFGYSSGKSASNKSFKEAFDKFIALLENVQALNLKLKSSEPIKANSLNSKAHRLRELKKLLDEKILTQEEFDLEKRKVLEEKE